MWTELRVLLVLSLTLLAPGWALLALSGTWPAWRGLQRWIVAFGLSLAFYPLLFYGLRILLPAFSLGPYVLGALLLAAVALTVWRLRGQVGAQIRFDRLEWAALVVVALTLFTRLQVAHTHPYPAWSDSLHHVLITELTATQGGLPASLAPYYPIPLKMYHLGLHALAAVVAWLAQAPAHTALLWTAQALNGLAGVGVYLVLDRKAGRIGALAGLVAVGLLSVHPAFYVNWGRFTQLAGQTLLLIAWCVTYDAVAAWSGVRRMSRGGLAWHTLFAALLTAGVFLLHFRVAAFYLALLAPSLAYLLWRLRRDRQGLARMVAGSALIGAGSLVLVLPALWSALTAYTLAFRNLDVQTVASEAEVAEVMAGYFSFDWNSIPYLAGPGWLLWLAIAGAALGLARGSRVAGLAVAWTAMLVAFILLPWLGVPALNVTNAGAVLIMLYLPVGLAVGAGVEAGLGLAPQRYRQHAATAVAAVTLVAGLVAAPARINALEPHRFFVAAADVEALRWAAANLPADAKFVVNTHFWLPTAPHGTDGGYWIPYFTERPTTANAMLLNLADYDYQSEALTAARLAETLELDPSAIDDLVAAGYRYVYVGALGNFEGPGLQVDRLLQSGRAQVLYAHDNVTILELGE